MEASGTELESVRVCKHLVYILGQIGKKRPDWVIKAAKDPYGNVPRLDEATKLLCETCRGLTTAETEEWIYNAHSKKARKLASWFERHQEWDKRRVAEEDAAQKEAIIRGRALKKLTPEEMRALGLID